MCWAVPLKILQIEGDVGKVDVGGAVREVGLQFIDDPQLGQYVLPLTLEFLHLLIDKGRLGDIEGVHAAYHRMLQEERGEVEATVVTARQVDEKTLDELREKLGRLTGKKVLLGHELDPALLGGMAVYLGETVIDGSLRSRLRRLRERLLEVRVH